MEAGVVTEQAARASEQLIQLGAVGVMLLVCVGALAWVFRRMDTRLEQTQTAADADRRTYADNMQKIASDSSASIVKTGEVLERLCKGQDQISDKIDTLPCRAPGGNNRGGRQG